MGDDETSLHCYNKGCLERRFDAATNNDKACLYHPGPPYFHDAYKIWNCCGKKSTDFSTWMSYKGCTTGPHNPNKPIDDEPKNDVQKVDIAPQGEYIMWNGLNKPAERSEEEKREWKPVPFEIGEQALKAIRRQKETMASNGDVKGDELTGATCKNNACRAVYSSKPESDDECKYHPGDAIFHEGMKYWSCCKRKTSDFTAFLDQAGCTTGQHLWVKSEKATKVKEDWFSSCGSIHINLYCKGTLPDQSLIETDGLALRMKIVHAYGTKESDLSIDLWGKIDPTASKAIVTERKVEVVLKQATPEGWPRLRYDPPSPIPLTNGSGE